MIFTILKMILNGAIVRKENINVAHIKPILLNFGIVNKQRQYPNPQIKLKIPVPKNVYPISVVVISRLKHINTN